MCADRNETTTSMASGAFLAISLRVIDFVQRRRRWCLAGLLAAIAVCSAFHFKSYWYISRDSSQYVGFARNYVNGEGFQWYGTSYGHRPVLMSVIYIPAFLLPDNPVVNIQIIQLLALFGVTLLTYATLRRFESPAVSLVVASMTGLNLSFVKVGSFLLSEIVYTAAVMGAIYVATFIFNSKRSSAAMMGTALLCACAALTRVIGVTLGVAIIPLALFSPGARLWGWGTRIRAAVLGVTLFAAPFFIWFHYNASQPRPEFYSGQETSYIEILTGPKDDSGFSVHNLVARAYQSAPRVIESIFQSAFSVAYRMRNRNNQWLWPGNMLAVPYAIAVFLGWWRRMRSEGGLMEWYFTLYIAILLIWPCDEGDRLMTPMVPLCWYYSCISLRSWVARSARIVWPAVVAVLLASSVCVIIADGLASYREFRPIAQARDSIESMGTYLNHRTDVPGGKIRLWMQSERTCHILRLLTNRPLLAYQNKLGLQGVINKSDAENASLLVLDFGTRNPTTPPERLSGVKGDQWRQVFSSGPLFAYEHSPGAAKPAGQAPPDGFKLLAQYLGGSTGARNY